MSLLMPRHALRFFDIVLPGHAAPLSLCHILFCHDIITRHDARAALRRCADICQLLALLLLRCRYATL